MFNILRSFNWFGLGDRVNLNQLTANDYYERLKLIALSLFEWKGLPAGCNSRYLEATLYSYGQALFIKDPTVGYMNTKATKVGLNVYEEAVKYVATATGYSQEFVADECVLIRNNLIERPTESSVILFATRLAEAERTIDVNVKAQKTPVMITCDDKDRLSMENVFKKINDNEQLILGSKKFDLDRIKAIKIDAPFVADKLQVYKHDIMNEALTFFGLNNANTEKRERLVEDEVNANNEVIDMFAEAMLLTRQEACEQINTLYPDLKVSVRLRSREEIMGQVKQVKEVNK